MKAKQGKTSGKFPGIGARPSPLAWTLAALTAAALLWGSNSTPAGAQHAEPAPHAPGAAAPARPADDHGKPAADDHGKPADDHAQPAAGDRGKPADDHGKPAEGHAKPTADDHGKPADDHGKPADDHGKPADDHGKPADDHGKSGDPHAGDAHTGDAHGEGGHGEGGHGEGHGGEHAEEVSIHLPTWIYGILKTVWRSGPATLNADGVIGATPEELQGQQIDYKYEDHHAHGSPKPTYDLRPTIGTIGKATVVGDKSEKLTINGKQVTLINPTVKFTLEGIFSEHLVISIMTMLTILAVAVLLTRKLQRLPDRRQSLLEIIYNSFDAFLYGLIGEGHRKYTWILVTAFIYIWCMNVSGLIPGWASPTANINVTAGMAIVIVAYVHIVGIRENGLKGYVMHFVGEPWWLFWLNVPIHLIGELAKVLSLTIRLFGNIFGEDVVIVILMLLSAKFTAGFAPFPLPMYFLALFTCTVQALVFTILSSVYIALMTAHHDDHGHGEHAHDGHAHDDHSHSHDVAAPAAA